MYIRNQKKILLVPALNFLLDTEMAWVRIAVSKAFQSVCQHAQII